MKSGYYACRIGTELTCGHSHRTKKAAELCMEKTRKARGGRWRLNK